MKVRMFTLVILLSTFTFAESNEMRCLKKTGCRWYCQLEYGSSFGKMTEEIQKNASVEMANGSCPEYTSEEDCVKETGCRWFCQLEYSSMLLGRYAEQVRKNALMEVKSGRCSRQD